MKYYIIRKGDDIQLVQYEEAPENVGLDRIDFNKGLPIEIPEGLVKLAKALIKQMNAEQQFDEAGYELNYTPTIDDVFNALYRTYYYYLKNGKILKLNRPLNPKFYVIGEGGYIALTDEQVNYLLHNPEASTYEVMHLGEKPEVPGTSPEVLLANAKATKLSELYHYDNSPNVNGFTINEEVEGWFTPTQRADHALSIQSAKNLGLTVLDFDIDNKGFQVSVEDAERMLSAIQLYANNCYMITKQHASAIEALTTPEEVEAYDITKGYPAKLNFEL